MSQSKETLQTGAHVSRIKSIKFFAPARSIKEANSILPKVNELVEGYVQALLPWKEDASTLQQASDSLWDLARVAALKSGTINPWDQVWDYVWKEASYSARENYGWYGGGYVSGEMARDAAHDAAKYASRYVAYESAKEKLQKPNPFEYVIELYSMGLKPTYFRKVNDQERFVVDFPIQNNNNNSLGCYVQGDSEIMYAHRWNEYCSGLQKLKEDFSSRNIL